MRQRWAITAASQCQPTLSVTQPTLSVSTAEWNVTMNWINRSARHCVSCGTAMLPCISGWYVNNTIITHRCSRPCSPHNHNTQVIAAISQWTEWMYSTTRFIFTHRHQLHDWIMQHRQSTAIISIATASNHPRSWCLDSCRPDEWMQVSTGREQQSLVLPLPPTTPGLDAKIHVDLMSECKWADWSPRQCVSLFTHILSPIVPTES